MSPDRRPQTLVLLSTALVMAGSVALYGADAAAQRVVAPDSVDRTTTSTDLGADVDDQSGADDEDDEPQPGESAFGSFDDVRVEHVTPDEIPNFQPGLPRGASSQMDVDDLPRSLSGERMTQVTEHVAAATIEVVAVQRPPAPYRSTDMIYRGHALWISVDDTGEDPVLVSTADWLEDADEIYAVDGPVSRALSESGLEPGTQESQSLDDFRADTDGLLERNRSSLARLDVVDSSRHVNLARLEAIDDQKLHRPTYGLVVHPMDATMPQTIFGFSPSVATSMTPVGYRHSDELEMEYSFYFLVTYQAILGAPIVGTDGRLIGISALRYPEEPEMSLAIPPGAIHGFVGTEHFQAGDDGDD